MSASHPIEWTVAQLAQAVERGQLELHYQPIVDLHSDQIGVSSRNGKNRTLSRLQDRSGPEIATLD